MTNSNSGGSSRPTIMQKATLSSYQAQQVHKRSYDSTSRSFYLLSVVLRSLSNDEQAVEVEAVVDASLEDIHDRLTKETTRLVKLCEDAGIEPVPHFSKPKEVMVEIATPRASKYLGLIFMLDKVIGLTSLLWLSGNRTDSQYNAECYIWQRNLQRVSNRIKEITKRAINAANKVKKAAEEEAQAKKDAAKKASGSSKELPEDDAVSEPEIEPTQKEGEEMDASEKPEAKKPVAKKVVAKKKVATKKTAAKKITPAKAKATTTKPETKVA